MRNVVPRCSMDAMSRFSPWDAERTSDTSPTQRLRCPQFVPSRGLTRRGGTAPRCRKPFHINQVRETGFEPAPLAGLDPKSSASANSATLAQVAVTLPSLGNSCIALRPGLTWGLMPRLFQPYGDGQVPAIMHGWHSRGTPSLSLGEAPSHSFTHSLSLGTEKAYTIGKANSDVPEPEACGTIPMSARLLVPIQPCLIEVPPGTGIVLFLRRDDKPPPQTAEAITSLSTYYDGLVPLIPVEMPPDKPLPGEGVRSSAGTRWIPLQAAPPGSTPLCLRALADATIRRRAMPIWRQNGADRSRE